MGVRQTIERYRKAAAGIGTGKFAPDNRRRETPAPAGGDMPLVGNINMQNGASLVQKPIVMRRKSLVAMINQDPITWGIHAMQRRLICQTPWDIVPDLRLKYEELDRFEDQAWHSVNEWNYECPFESTILPSDVVAAANDEIKKIIASSSNKDPEVQRKKRSQIAAYFTIVKAELEQNARIHCGIIRKMFIRPNEHLENTWRSLLELIIRDLQIDDSGIIVKNYNGFNRLSELWHIPGYLVHPIVYPDFTVPQSPNAAYAWIDDGIAKGWYAKNKLSYMMANPQGNGIGMSPSEVLVQQISASILGFKVHMANLEEGNIPPGIINLKDATKAQRETFEKMLNAKCDMSRGNRFIVVSRVPSENGELQYVPIPKGVDFQKAQVMEFMKMDPGIKAFAHGFQAADIGMIMDAKGAGADPATLDMLSTRRAVTGPLTLVEDTINSDIIGVDFAYAADCAFRFEQRPAITPNVSDQATADSVLVNSGVLSRNDVRRRRKERPIPGGNVYTIGTGNALFQVDALEEMKNGMMQAGTPGTNPDGSVTPNGSGDPKNRNNANDRANTKGNEPRGGPPRRGG